MLQRSIRVVVVVKQTLLLLQFGQNLLLSGLRIVVFALPVDANTSQNESDDEQHQSDA